MLYSFSSTMASPRPRSQDKQRLSDKEAIVCLLNAVSKHQVSLPNEIDYQLPLIDIYSYKDPRTLFKDCANDEEIYFLTPLKKSARGKYSRKVGNGSWVQTGETINICGNSGKIGTRRSFKFVIPGSTRYNDAQHLLREYTLGLPEKFKVCFPDDNKESAFCILVKRDHSCDYGSRFYMNPPTESSIVVDGYLDQILKANTTTEPEYDQAGPSS